MEYNNNCINYKVNPNPLNLPDYTVRLRYKPGTEPPDYHSPTTYRTLVDADKNIWDITKISDYWYGLLDYEPNMIEVIGGNISGVTNLEYAFYNCSALTSVKITNLSNVMSLHSTFSQCGSLEKVTLYNTNNLLNVNSMFFNCSSMIVAPELSTDNVTNMTQMFALCTNLSSAPLYNTSKVTNMYKMFDMCRNLKSVPLYDTSKVTNMNNMFEDCQNLTSIPLFNTDKVQNMDYTFHNCIKVQSGALALYQQASTQTTPPTAHYWTFKNCGKNTQTGKAELAQIPSDWGGTGV